MSNKKLIWLVIVVIVLAIVFIGMRKGSTINSGVTPTPNLSATPKASSSPVVKKPPVVTATPALGNYSQLVTEYRDRRVQFNNICQMSPSALTYKNGTKIMLDNRSSESRVVTIDGTPYNFSGYSYRFVTLSSNTLPRTLAVNCGPSINVGVITLQR
ncbi:MAG: hypothetical protein UW27_C0014G0004 [Parcubacteria group bacterium GW2011_GWA1_44_13]|uniref:Uncharacterized protein n=2 Tax=Candidatus Yanofskyibacteriota TaxID=1752733 RepID=A0A1F8G453_9BACT|nr:MAG: hypothetical protein UW27_C0014G0004 [Parcubacteria group bacterium GW2011_GWA1_44_13]OGN20124.1 MAG: hypothetical protein A3F25_01210 [Candidatus Yanofskybacteria bacterium RIFCSPHIGHO2_12_FULL_45_19b]OGN32683.1 MAG: hypothetical protein A3I32_02270 [Candidatus Yanofskybacteria bacterium RIFCSPLOWO2_02_FULL_45_10]